MPPGQPEPGDHAAFLSSIAFLEIHDADVESITLLRGGVISVLFAHLATYCQRAPDLYDVWSCRAEVRLEGADSATLLGTLPTDRGGVSDGGFVGDDQEPVEFLDCLRGQQRVRRMWLDFVAGATFEVTAQSAVLDGLRTTRDEPFEVWEGPLSRS